MLTWPHSGFHVHASDSFRDPDRIRRTLSYAFRPAVSLKQLSYNPKEKQITYWTGDEAIPSYWRHSDGIASLRVQ